MTRFTMLRRLAFLLACLALPAVAGAQDFIRYYPPGVTGLTSSGTVITSTLPIILPDGAGTDGAGSLNWGAGAASQPRMWANTGQNSLYIGLSATNYVQLSGASITAVAGGAFRIAGDTTWTREGAAIWQAGVDAATAIAYTIKGGDSTGANVAGGAVTLKGGAGTSGNAAGGPLILSGGVNAGTGEPGAVAIADGGTKPTCAAGIRGSIWYDAGGAGAADTIEICAHKSDNSYAWVALATPIS